MADLLKTGSDWLLDQFKSHVSQTVTYRRGMNTVALTATLALVDVDVADESGFQMRRESWDFLIHSADLVLAGKTVLPQPEDEILVTEGNLVHVHRALDIGLQSHWKYADSYKKAFRIHTKRMKTQAA